MLTRLTNNAIGRLLHDQIYNRTVAFCNRYTPEFPAEPIVNDWLNRVFAGDETIHILFECDDSYKITAHAVITISEAYGYRIVSCHQIQAEMKSKVVNEFAEQVNKYIETLRDSIGAVCDIIYVEKNAKVYEKRFGYKTARTVLFRCSSHSETIQEMEKTA